MNKFLKATAERAAKTFVQAYIAIWTLRAGLGDTSVESNADAFDLLFTLTNVKAGIVAVVLSVGTSFASRPFGAEESPSLLKSGNS